MAQKISPDDVTCAALGCCTTTLLLTKYYFCPCFCNMSSMGDGLNAGAATYTPHDPTAPAPETRRASQMSDDSMMDEIEAALENQGNFGGGSAAVYSDLPPHAEEFWFPECRDCPCCNGFKHGCQCCSSNGGGSCSMCCAGGGATTTTTTTTSVNTTCPTAPPIDGLPSLD